MPNCPICSDAMVQQDRDGITIDICGKHGIWLDRSELLAITEASRHSEGTFVFGDLMRAEVVPPTDHTRVIACPHCSQDMKIENYKEVNMDVCGEHGVWLDSGELEAVLNNLRLDPSFVRGVALRLWEGKY